MDGRAALETVNYTRELAHALSVRLFSRPSYAFCLRSRSSRRRFPASRNAATDAARMTTARAFGRTADTRYFSIRWEMFCLQERKKVEFVARAIVYGIMESI